MIRKVINLKEKLRINKYYKRIFESLIYDVYYDEEFKRIIIYGPITTKHFNHIKKMLRFSPYEYDNIIVQ